ncbi:MAG: nuclear transport factor 2 family protein [Isosphaeraceae bacterium]
MTFLETLDQHLRSIRERNLDGLIATLPDRDDDLLLIMSNGKLVRSVRTFIELHRDWFASPTWTLSAEQVSATETPDLGIAVLRLAYHDEPPGAAPVDESSLLTLVFARRDSRWVMIQDQNTPIRQRSA